LPQAWVSVQPVTADGMAERSTCLDSGQWCWRHRFHIQHLKAYGLRQMLLYKG